MASLQIFRGVLFMFYTIFRRYTIKMVGWAGENEKRGPPPATDRDPPAAARPKARTPPPGVVVCNFNRTFAAVFKTNMMNTDPEHYQQVERFNEEKTELLSRHYREIIRLLGEDPGREGLLSTPARVAKSMQFMTRGYAQDPREILRSALFKEDYRQMVIVKDIEIYSLCEHHLLPFFGRAHVAYIPNGYITGLSKIARVVEAFARRLQLQERLTRDIKTCIHETLNPLGVAVVIEARHTCMVMRGVQKQHSVTTTSDFSGAFEKLATREEFIRLISNKFH
jgi:GTP cyclohydrolase I